MKKLNFVLLFTIAIIFLLPLIFTLWGSFIDAYGTMKIPPKIMAHYTLDNYKIVISFINLRWILNTFILTLLTVIPSILISVISGYGLYLKNSRLIIVLLIIIAMIPRYAILIPQFLIFSFFHLNSTLIACAIPLWVTPIHILIASVYFRQFPTTIVDAGKIDGLSTIGILFRILLPETKSLLICLTLLKTIDAWLDFLWQYLQLSANKSKTFYVGMISWLQMHTGGSAIGMPVNPIGYGLVVSVLLLIPFLVLFLYGNKYFIYELGGSE